MSQNKYLSKKLMQCGLLATSIAATSGQAIASNDLKFNGFMSIGAAIVDTDDKAFKANPALPDTDYTIGGFTDEFDMKNGSLFALQVSKNINDLVSVTGQLVARGAENFDMDATWAYVTFAPTDIDSIRAGKLRAPFFYYSDFLEVGYAYNWVRPPINVYSRIPFSTFEGIDYTRQFEIGDVTGSAQFYYGRYDDEIVTTDTGTVIALDLHDMFGVVLNASWENFNFRASYHRSNLNSDNPLFKDTLQAGFLASGGTAEDSKAFLLDNKTTSFAELAVVYDDGANIGIFEYTVMDHDNAAFTDNSAWLATYGRRISNVTLHLTYTAENNSTESGAIGAFQKVIGTNSEDVTSVIAGVRYDISSGTALKFEIENKKEENFKGDEAKGKLFSVAVDVVF